METHLKSSKNKENKTHVSHKQMFQKQLNNQIWDTTTKNKNPHFTCTNNSLIQKHEPI